MVLYGTVHIMIFNQQLNNNKRSEQATSAPKQTLTRVMSDDDDETENRKQKTETETETETTHRGSKKTSKSNKRKKLDNNHSIPYKYSTIHSVISNTTHHVQYSTV